MKNYLMGFLFCSAGLALSACGGVHSVILKQPDGSNEVKAVRLVPVEVVSQEQHEGASKNNERLKKIAEDEMQLLLDDRKISASPDSQEKVECRISVTYGNRALRYWVGFGAGSGSLTVTIELKDKDDNVRYATQTKADLAMGGFGGDMFAVARNAIKTAFKEFGSRI